MAQVREFATYRDFDVPSKESAVQYLSPGLPDRANEGAYHFGGKIHSEPLYALATVFLVWFLLRNAGSLDWRMGLQRGLSQWVVFVLLRLGMFRVAGAAKIPRCAAGVVPVLNCQACEMATGACPIGQIQQSIMRKSLPAIALGTILTTGALSGRFICGWLCPCGMFSDMLDRISIKRFRPAHYWRWGGFAALGLAVVGATVLLFAGIRGQSPFCSTFCMSGKIYGLLPYYSTTAAGDVARIGGSPGLPVFLFHAALFAIWILLAVLISGRVFCRYICPLGALLGTCNRIAAVRVEHVEANCTSCGRCLPVCPQGIDLANDDFLTQAACIRCGRCVSVCAQGGRRWVLPWAPADTSEDQDAKRNRRKPLPAG